jgi:hypothetical protein
MVTTDNVAHTHCDTIMRILHYNAKKNCIECNQEAIRSTARELDQHLLRMSTTFESYLDRNSLKRRIMKLLQQQVYPSTEECVGVWKGNSTPNRLGYPRQRPSIVVKALRKIASGMSLFATPTIGVGKPKGSDALSAQFRKPLSNKMMSTTEASNSRPAVDTFQEDLDPTMSEEKFQFSNKTELADSFTKEQLLKIIITQQRELRHAETASMKYLQEIEALNERLQQRNQATQKLSLISNQHDDSIRLVKSESSCRNLGITSRGRSRSPTTISQPSHSQGKPPIHMSSNFRGDMNNPTSRF